MADTELKIRVSAQLEDVRAGFAELQKLLSQIAQGSSNLGAVATQGFERMEAAAERAAKASADAATAAQRIGDAIEKANQKANQPPPTPKPPKPVELTAGLADQEAIQKAASKAQLAVLDAQYREGSVKTKAYYAQRAEIQRSALRGEIAAAQAAAQQATSQSARNAAATRAQVLQTQLSAISSGVPKKAAEAEGFAGVLNKAKGAAAALGLALGAVATVKGFLSLSDQAKTLDARLKLSTSSTEEFATAQAKLFELAQKTRTDVGQTVELYAKFSTSTKDLGVSQGELLRVTETVSKAIKLSGGSSESANAAIIQLGQGLASGTLRGEELNSVLEQSPRLAQAIAKGLGVGVGELRKMGAEGKISSEALLDALQSQADAIDSEFKTLPRTVDGAMTVLKNSLLKGAAEFDKATGISDGFARAIEATGPIVEETLALIADAFTAITVPIKTTFDQIGDGFEALGAALGDTGVMDSVRSFTRGFMDLMGNALAFVGEAFQMFVPNVIAVVQTLTVRVVARLRVLGAEAKLLKELLVAVFTDTTIEDAYRSFEESKAEIATEEGQSIDLIFDNLLKSKQSATRALAAMAEERRKAEELAKKEVAAGPRTGKAKKGGPGADMLELQKEQLRQQLDDLKRVYDLMYMATEDYYEERYKLQNRMLAIEIAQERRTLAKANTADAKAKSLTNLEMLELKRYELAKQADDAIVDYRRETEMKMDELRAAALVAEGKVAEARKLELVAQYKDLRDRFRIDDNKEGMALIDKLIGYDVGKAHLEELAELTSLRVKQLEMEGRPLEARNLEIEQSYAELMERFQRAGDTDGIAFVERLIGYEKGKAQLAQIGTDVERVMAEFRAKEESAANSVLTGQSSQTGAFEAVRIAASDAIPLLEQYREKLALLAPTSIEAAAALRQVDANIAELGGKKLTGSQLALRRLTEEIKGLQTSFQTDAAFALRDSLKGLFDDIITGSKKGADALRDFARNFSKAILSIITQLIATQAAKAILSKGSGLLGILGTGLGAVKHSGGVVGEGGAMRSVPMVAFLGAPKLHTGGTLGLWPDEVPTILQKGEEVLSRNDPRNVRNRGAAGATTMLVQLHPDHNHRTMRDWLEGELARVAATS